MYVFTNLSNLRPCNSRTHGIRNCYQFWIVILCDSNYEQLKMLLVDNVPKKDENWNTFLFSTCEWTSTLPLISLHKKIIHWFRRPDHPCHKGRTNIRKLSMVLSIAYSKLLETINNLFETIGNYRWLMRTVHGCRNIWYSFES